jgi:hypothetical protein
MVQRQNHPKVGIIFPNDEYEEIEELAESDDLWSDSLENIL